MKKNKKIIINSVKIGQFWYAKLWNFSGFDSRNVFEIEKWGKSVGEIADTVYRETKNFIWYTINLLWKKTRQFIIIYLKKLSNLKYKYKINNNKYNKNNEKIEFYDIK